MFTKYDDKLGENVAKTITISAIEKIQLFLSSENLMILQEGFVPVF